MSERAHHPDMEANCSRSRPLRAGLTYHFNVIYNHARCPLSTTDDTQLSVAWTRHAVEVLHKQGLVSSYYHDRDRSAGQGMVQEMTRVIKASQVTLVLLSPGFVRDCWPRYWLLSSFRSLFQRPTSQSSGVSYSVGESRSTSSSLWTNNWRSSPRVDLTSPTTPDSDPGPSEVVLVALGLQPQDLPEVLQEANVLFFPRDWQRDPSAWHCLQGAVSLDPLPGEHLEERSELDKTEEHSSLYSSFSTEGSVPDREEILFSASTMPKPKTASRIGRPRSSNEDAQVSEDSAIYTDEYDETINTSYKEARSTNDSLGTQKQKYLGERRAESFGRKEGRLGSMETKTGTGQATPATSARSGDVESAVIDRLCNTGLRRESVEEDSSITRVYVHGNTVSIDTIRTNTPRRTQPSPRGAQSQATESNRSSESVVKKELLTSTVKETISDITFGHRGDEETSPSVVRSQDSRLSSKNETVSSPSTRRKLQYSEEYGGSPSDASYSISLTTQDCDRLASPRRLPRPEGIPQQARKSPRTGNHAEESNRTDMSTVTNVEVSTPHQRRVPSYRGYSARAEDRSSLPGRDAVDSIASSTVLNQSTSLVTSSVLGHVTQNTNSHVLPQTVYARDMPSRENGSQDNVQVSTENASNTKGQNIHHQPRKDTDLPLVSGFQSTLTKTSKQGIQETVTRKGAEEPMTKQTVEEPLSQNNFITSIEDEHQVITHDKDLSESWTTSEYGTMSPRNDLESSANLESGFLSGGLTSFGYPSAPTDDPQFKKRDDNDAGTSDPELLNKFTKQLQQEEAKCEIKFLKKSSMTETSFGKNNTLIQNTTTQIDDTSDGSYGISFPNSVTLEQSSKLTVKNSSQNSKSNASNEKAAAGPERVDLLARPQGAVSQQTTQDDVTEGGTVSARASRFSDANIRHTLSRKSSWLYIDVDKDWCWFRMMLPLYRIMCYALSKPEMPYF